MRLRLTLILGVVTKVVTLAAGLTHVICLRRLILIRSADLRSANLYKMAPYRFVPGFWALNRAS